MECLLKQTVEVDEVLVAITRSIFLSLGEICGAVGFEGWDFENGMVGRGNEFVKIVTFVCYGRTY